jgi:hypothetical protein
MNRRIFIVTLGSVVVGARAAQTRQGQKEKPDSAELKTVTLIIDGMT